MDRWVDNWIQKRMKGRIITQGRDHLPTGQVTHPSWGELLIQVL